MRKLLIVAALVAAAGIGAWVFGWAQAAPHGPQPIAWDREACAHCRMLIGDPGFAGQILTDDDRVLAYDDPGCLLLALDQVKAREVWLHHAHEDRWLALDAAGFAPAAHTPMGYDLAVVDRDAPGALTVAQARRRLAPASSETARSEARP